jgi:pimeloyl-ACP methyl ester carboxylesterase
LALAFEALTTPPFGRQGTPGGPLVILVHGAVANRCTWLPVARRLPAAYEVWCPDLPGHGALRDEPFRMERALDVVAALVARAAPRRPIVAGDSLGGYVALAYAARSDVGERVAGIVAGGCTWSMTGAAGLLARLSDVPPTLLERVIGSARLERFATSLLPRVTDSETARCIAAAGLRLAARGESLRELAGLDLVRVVRAIGVPIVFVNGRYDWPTRAGERELLRAAANARLVVSPRSGHGVGIFDPQAFANAIRGLVSEPT